MGIDGTGFYFAQRREQFYTRVGQFEFNDDGYLVDKTFGYRVAAYDNGRFTDINLQNFRAIGFSPTTSITLIGIYRLVRQLIP